MTSATSCYISYCLQNGYSVVGTNTIATTSKFRDHIFLLLSLLAHMSKAGGALVTVTPTGKTTPSRSTLSVSSPTSSSTGSSTSSGSNLSSGGKGGIAIAVLGFLSAILALIKNKDIKKWYHAMRNKRKANKDGGVVTVVEHPDKIESGNSGHAADTESGNGGHTTVTVTTT